MDIIRILDYVCQTAGSVPEELVPVDGGLSKADKYKALLNGREWMVKVVPGTPVRDLWYRELDNRSNDQMANPKMHKLFDDGTLCLLSPWIPGKSLESCLKCAKAEQVEDYGMQAAQILLHLHEIPYSYPEYKQRLSDRVNMACCQVENIGLKFTGHQQCCEFLKKAINVNFDQVCFVHRDIRPENFIVHDERLHLIDFDNGSLGERATDFSYLTTMGYEEHRAFAKAVIRQYLAAVDSTDFWQKNLFYSTLQVVEYAIWKYQNKGRQMRLQAENLLEQYDNFRQLIPYWWNM